MAFRAVGPAFLSEPLADPALLLRAPAVDDDAAASLFYVLDEAANRALAPAPFGTAPMPVRGDHPMGEYFAVLEAAETRAAVTEHINAWLLNHPLAIINNATLYSPCTDAWYDGAVADLRAAELDLFAGAPDLRRGHTLVHPYALVAAWLEAAAARLAPHHPLLARSVARFLTEQCTACGMFRAALADEHGAAQWLASPPRLLMPGPPRALYERLYAPWAAFLGDDRAVLPDDVRAASQRPPRPVVSVRAAPGARPRANLPPIGCTQPYPSCLIGIPVERPVVEQLGVWRQADLRRWMAKEGPAAFAQLLDATGTMPTPALVTFMEEIAEHAAEEFDIAERQRIGVIVLEHLVDYVSTVDDWCDLAAACHEIGVPAPMTAYLLDPAIYIELLARVSGDPHLRRAVENAHAVALPLNPTTLTG